MTVRILPHFLILIVVLCHCIIHGKGQTPPCDGILSDIFATSEVLLFQSTVPSSGEAPALLSQEELDILAEGFIEVYNELQGDNCDNETIIATSAEGTQIVRLRRNLQVYVNRIVSFRIRGNCRACGNRPLIGNDAPGRFLQQNGKDVRFKRIVSKINRGRFMKEYRLWLDNQRASGRFTSSSEIRARSIVKEGKIEIVDN